MSTGGGGGNGSNGDPVHPGRQKPPQLPPRPSSWVFPPVKMHYEASEMGLGAEDGCEGGCKCGPNCKCNPCNC